jgi:hypothetical protein
MRTPTTETTLEREVHHSVHSALVHPHRELAHRVNGGIEVTLYWNPHDNSTSIEVWQPATEETLVFTVAQEQALDAFYHPFAHFLEAGTAS